MNQNSGWQFAIDVGGTFTDCLAIAPDGTQHVHKLLSSGLTLGRIQHVQSTTAFGDSLRTADPSGFWVGYRFRLPKLSFESTVVEFDAASGRLELDDPLPSSATPGTSYELFSDEHSPTIAIRYILQLGLTDLLPPLQLRMGTTRGTNALLTGQGAPTAFVTTRGFGDILKIRNQQRPRLFDLDIRRPPVIFQTTVEVDERIAADGSVLKSLELESARDSFQQLIDNGIRAVAICLLNAYGNPEHEQQLGELARSLSFDDVSVSSEVSPLIKIVPRGETTIANAYLNPILRGYVEEISDSLHNDSTFRMMTSSGGLVSANRFTGSESIFSGPAGGVVGLAQSARSAGFEQAIGFDMGGTSTDVSRFGGEFELVHSVEKNGLHLATPSLAIETVAAGGGSICDFDGVQLTVGPASAGAHPGPACYGRGGPLTITDMNLMLGRVASDQFPFPLDVEAVNAGLRRLCDTIAESGKVYTPLELAEGFVQIANANMVRAINAISTRKGYDPREHLLVSFGGAAPQHACALARQLQIRRVLNHPHGGILSAAGIAAAELSCHEAASVLRPLNESRDDLHGIFETLESNATQKVADENIATGNVTCARTADLRYIGQDSHLTIPYYPPESLEHRFHSAHQQRYGFADPDRDIEVVAARVIATSQTQRLEEVATKPTPTQPTASGEQSVTFSGKTHRANVYERVLLAPGDTIIGPAVIAESISTTIVDPGWTASVLSDGQLLLEDAEGPSQATSRNEAYDPIQLEVFSNAFMGIAEQMGFTLQNTASSVNVKERLDFSCAIFTADGELVVNAPHVPVHLGAMGETVRQVIREHPDLVDGDVIITNDPFRGGSHLPDVTIITPVFDGDERVFFTASRAHHAEIGGILPGSMPPFSKTLAEEGVLIRSQKIVAAGESQMEKLRELLASGVYPSRDIESNLADFAAQIAANQKGASGLIQMVAAHGKATVLAYMQHIQTTAEQKMRLALSRLPDGEMTFEDALDDGSTICVKITIDGDNAIIDFAGSDDVHPENLNANPAITRAAVIYVLRCLLGQDSPLNGGLLRPIDLRIPPGILNPPDHGDPAQNAAIVGGNVETSQRIVDVLLGAFGLAAASQGTMNNVLFGNQSFGYYETICGGAGATATAHGASAVHTHMTNTRLTDPEILEQRFPVRLKRFGIRDGSGGAGKNRGGDGIIREIEFLQPLDVSIVSQRRERAPYGIAGGAAGATGRNTLVLADGTVRKLPGRIHFRANSGDVLRIETPGGGGYGPSY
ncbi:MAG: hydantoinase B/oxoprolinase family protein [Planctomycetota bacterium]